MRTGRPTPPVVLTAEERQTLEQWARRPTTAQGLAQRARLVLACASSKTNGEIAAAAGVTRQTVGRWRHRFVRKRLPGLLDEPRPGAPRKITDAEVERVIALTLERTPRDATHWSTRAMAKRSGLSQTAVSRIWRAFGLQPHRSETFKLSKDPLFIDKVRDIVGLYLDPPDKALVLCCDEKSQCQALERTQPGLPLGIGHIKTRTHDYIRHGTLTLFAALNYLDGKLISRIAKRHRHQEWLAFLKTINREVPAGLTLHLIADNYATHKHPKVKAWLAQHPRFHMHFTPTSSSWLNLIERFFRDLTDFITQKSFASVGELSEAIISFLAARNANARRYVWQAKGEDILRKIAAAREKLTAQRGGETCKPISETLH